MANRPLERWLDEDILGSSLFAEAITHRSAGGKNNERLEYLGDAVLGMIIAEHLFSSHPSAKEGDLSRLRAYLVRRETLAGIARELRLGDIIALGSGELKSGGHYRDTILGDALEAIIGAVYLIKDFEYTKSFVLGLFQARIARLPNQEQLKDPKTKLQEYLQARNLPLPEYRLRDISGESHAQHFKVLCYLEVSAIETIGEGSSKREAEQQSASKALDIIYGEQEG